MVDDDQPEIQSVLICGHLRNLWMTDSTLSSRRGLSEDFTDFRRFLFRALTLHDACLAAWFIDHRPEIQSVVICGHLRNLWMKDNAMSFRRGLSADFTDFRRFLFRAFTLHDACLAAWFIDHRPEIQSVLICGHLRNLWMKNSAVSSRRDLSADYTDLRRFLFRAVVLHDAMPAARVSITGWNPI